MKNKNCINMCGLISKSFNTPYNWGIGLMTLVLWIFTSDSISYYNNSNFDMLVTLHGYIQLLGLGAVIVGLIKADEKYLLLAKYGIITYLVSALTLIFTRNVFFTVYLAHFVLKLASIFFFLMIIRQIWNLTNSSVMGNSISTYVADRPITLITLLDKIKDYEERIWYANETIKNGWSRDTMIVQIQSDLYGNRTTSS